MLRLPIFTFTLFLCVTTTNANTNYKDYFQYIFPIPNSKYVSTYTTIIIRFKEEWPNDLKFSSLKINVDGELSGNHDGTITLAHDQKTIIFKPNQKFAPHEVVKVEIISDLLNFQNPFIYAFTTSGVKKFEWNILERQRGEFKLKKNVSPPETYGMVTLVNGVAVPSDFPRIDVDTLQIAAPGKLFLTNLEGYPYIMILENDGTPYFYRRMQETFLDFKVQPTGTLTCGTNDGLFFLEMNENYEIIDTLICGNSYITDYHDIQLLPDGHKLFIAIDYQIVDMSQLVTGGDTSANVIGNHIIELDEQNNIVLEWLSWDHYDILDATHTDLTTKWIDYVHINAIAVDYDNHILISSRNLEEVTKIDRQTGDIIWRLGGKITNFSSSMMIMEYHINMTFDQFLINRIIIPCLTTVTITAPVFPVQSNIFLIPKI
jgi:hypothetical protein